MGVPDLFDQPTNVTDPAEFFIAYPNDLTGGLWGVMFLMAVYIIAFGALHRFGVERAFAASSFIGLLVSITLTALGIIGGEAFTLSIVLVLLAILFGGGDRL